MNETRRRTAQIIATVVVIVSLAVACYLILQIAQVADVPTPTQAPTATSTFTSTPSPTSTVTSTPIPVPTATGTERFIATVQSSGGECYNGPGQYYQRASIIPGGQVKVLGRNSDGGDWFMIQGGETRCWMETRELTYDFDPTLPLTLYTAYTKTDSICRTGPGTVYKEQTYIPKGWRIFIDGKNNNDANWIFVTPHDSTRQCWVAGSLLNMTDFSPIALVDTPDPPTAIVAMPPDNGGGGGNGNGENGGNGGRPTPTETRVQPTATLCWPPGQCKTPKPK